LSWNLQSICSNVFARIYLLESAKRMNTDILQTLPTFFPASLSRFTASLLAFEPNTLSGNTTTLSTSIDALCKEYATLASQINAATERIDRARQPLERFGVWSEYAEHKAASGIEDALVTLGGMMRSRGKAEEALMRHGDLPQSIIARSAWFWFEREYGHRALGEGDIAVPRFADDRALAFQAALTRPIVRSYDDEFGNTQTLSLKARIFTGAAEERESACSAAMRRFHALRKELLSSATILVQTQRIPALEAFWELSIDEALQLFENG
jgi:hypothetical protein